MPSYTLLKTSNTISVTVNNLALHFYFDNYSLFGDNLSSEYTYLIFKNSNSNYDYWFEFADSIDADNKPNVSLDITDGESVKIVEIASDDATDIYYIIFEEGLTEYTSFIEALENESLYYQYIGEMEYPDGEIFDNSSNNEPSTSNITWDINNKRVSSLTINNKTVKSIVRLEDNVVLYSNEPIT